jgi:uncharacterized protein (TIGR02466 family)
VIGLPFAGQHAVAALLERLRSAADKVESDLAEATDNDPFCTIRPKRARLVAWSLVQPRSGHQISHIHPTGWLSGVYYVRVPAIRCPGARSGYLVLGSLPSKCAEIDPPWGVRYIEPLPGRLVMFPSHIPHATIPTGSEEPRICVAFDVVPVQSDAHSVQDDLDESGFRLSA